MRTLRVVIGVITLIFVLATLFIVASIIFDGNLVPIFKALNPHNTNGLLQNSYLDNIERLQTGYKVMFGIAFLVPFVFVLFWFLYKKEETTVPFG